MVCSKCGNEMPDGAGNSRANGAENGREIRLTYDYKVAKLPKGRAAEWEDAYRSLGWEVADRKETLSGAAVTLRRARDPERRERRNRLERKLEDALEEEILLERRKTKSAKISAGLIGTAATLVFGGGLCLCLTQSAPGAILAGCALGIAGAGLGALAYLVYRKIARKTTAQTEPLLEKQRDEIAGLIEEARQDS